MEINPKFWASYALASRYGYRFASALVAGVLDDSRNLRSGRLNPWERWYFHSENSPTTSETAKMKTFRMCS